MRTPASGSFRNVTSWHCTPSWTPLLASLYTGVILTPHYRTPSPALPPTFPMEIPSHVGLQVLSVLRTSILGVPSAPYIWPSPTHSVMSEVQMIPQRGLTYPLTLQSPSAPSPFPTPCFIFLIAPISRIISLSLTPL